VGVWVGVAKHFLGELIGTDESNTTLSMNI